MNLTIPALGTVTGAGTISPAGALAFKMVANLSGGAVSGVTQLAGLGGGGKGASVPFTISGTTSNPTFTPDVGGILSNQLGNQLKNAIPSGQSGSPLEGLGGLFGKKKKR